MAAVSPNGCYGYVSGQAGSIVSVVATRSRTVAARIPVGQPPHGLAFRVVRQVLVPGQADEMVPGRKTHSRRLVSDGYRQTCRAIVLGIVRLQGIYDSTGRREARTL
jgi:YVTN family beta-propeller protein